MRIVATIIAVVTLMLANVSMAKANKTDKWCCLQGEKIAKFTSGKRKNKNICVQAKTKAQRKDAPDKWVKKPKRISSYMKACTSKKWGLYKM